MKINDILNSKVYSDDILAYRFYDGFGQDVQKFVSANQPCDASTGYWTLTATATSPVVNSVTTGEYATITTAATEYAGDNMQLKGEGFKFSGNKPLYFGAKVKVSDATNLDLLIGLCETKTDLLKAASSHGITTTLVEGAFFFKADAATAITTKSYVAGSQTATANVSTALDALYHIYEIYYDGQFINFYYDGSLVNKINSGFPTGDLTPSFNVKVGATAAAKTVSIAWVRAIQINS